MNKSGKAKWPRVWLCRAALLLLAPSLVAPAAAHDSWLRLADAQRSDDLLVLELSGGARYPRSEWPTPAARLASSGCVDAAGSHLLVARSEQPTALEMRARLDRVAPVTCWVELKPQDIVIEAALVPVYFDDIRAPDPVRRIWAQQSARGVPWKEVYRKFVRIEVARPGVTDMAALRRPLNVALELLPLGGAPLRRNVESEYVALADGKPLAGLAVEFVSHRSPVGVWRQSDGNGRFRFAPPFAGEWLLRGTALDGPPGPDQVWHSRFATFTVSVQ